MTPHFSEGSHSWHCAVGMLRIGILSILQSCPTCLRRSAKVTISWWLCHFPPAPLVTVFNEQFNSFLLLYLLCVRKMQQNERGKKCKTFFLGNFDKLFKNKSKENFVMVLPLNYNNLIFIAWLYRIIISWLTYSI